MARLRDQIDEGENRADVVRRRRHCDPAAETAMTAHPERERDIAGHQPAKRKPLGEPLEHRAHDKSERLEILDPVFQFDRFDEELGAAARHQRRITSATRQADQLHAAAAKPRAYCVRTEARQFAQPAHPPSCERGLEIVAAI